ncbi:pericentriolar material 1 protein-like isoform X3 [Myxocyprinus asiaticus]|uniref:pericentriolar material 1 protein-like isoform X3 n=1 Tax=Myxocyprinus asiaticus TaxID=70543 RepID=UPI002222DCAF|nr:pericentriolar material 1 protein-like isoform X3 [Myxocyprinus asiaticus]
MATGGAPFEDGTDEQEQQNWTISNGSLDDRLNNMDWGVQQKKANRSSEKNRKKFSAMSESRLTNDISPESSPGAGRRRARTPHTYPHVKYSTQMSVPDQAELDRLRQVINFTDLDERSIGSDSQGRATAANNQRQLSTETKKPFNFLPIHLNTNKSKEPTASAFSSPGGKEPKKQSPGKELFAPVPAASNEAFSLDSAQGFVLEDEQGELTFDSSQVVSKLVQIREYIGKATSMRDDLLEKNDVPANVERLSLLIAHLKEQEKSYLRFLQKILARENEDEDEGATVDSAVGSGSVAESTSLNLEPCSEASSATGHGVCGEQKEELENMRKQHDLLKKMLEQQEQLRALQGRQAALLAMQQSAEQAIAVMDDTVVTETTGSVSGRSITSELNDELNDLIQRFHNQLHDSQSRTVPDNRRQAECLSLSREVCRSRTSHNSRRQLLTTAPLTTASTSASAKLTKLQELQDKKQTMDKILQELHSLRDQTLNNSSCQSVGQRVVRMGVSERPSVLGREGNGPRPVRQDSSSSYTQIDDNSHPSDKLRKLKEVHKRLNELKELVQYYEQTSDMVVDTVNENVEDDDAETEDGSLFEAMFDSEQENREPVTNIRNPAQPQTPGNRMDMNSLTKAHSTSNNRDGRLNTECEINNRSATNLRSLNVPSVTECQYNRDRPYDGVNDEEDDDGALEEEDGARGGSRDSDGSRSSRRSNLEGDVDYVQKVHRLQTAKQKLRQLQELVAMVQSDDSDGTTANEDEDLKQQPNNIRATAPKAQRDITLSDKAREKLYEEKLKQQQQELKQLHKERQRLMDIQGKIQDLQWACPDLKSSVSSSASGQMMRKIPAAASTPAPVPLHSSSAKANTSGLKPTAEPPPVTITDNELWSEMRRHQILREELRQRRKHLESLMAEQQRRSTLTDSPFRSDTHDTQSYSRDERTMATWGGSTQCPLGDDSNFSSEMGAEEDDDEHEHDEGEESSSTDELHACSTRKQRNFNMNKDTERLKVHREVNRSPSPCESRGHPRQQQDDRGSCSRTRRQENLRWAADLSLSEGIAPTHWKEQITHLQKQLNFSTTMCQTLLQDQQTLSYMLQTLLTGPYGVIPNNVTSPQVPLIMHQLNQCYIQLAWQQNNVNRLKQALNDLLRQKQQNQSLSGQQQHQNIAHDSVPHALFLNYPTVNTLNMPGLPNVSPFPTVGEFQHNQASSDQQHDANTSLKTEYMSFPPPLQRSPLNNTEKRFKSQPDTVTDPHNSSWLNSSLNRCNQRPTLTSDHPNQMEEVSPSSSPVPHPSTSWDQSYIPDSQESLSSLPERADPTTVTKTFRAGRKAAAQASLSSRDKTPKTKSRRRKRGRGPKNTAALESDSVSSDAHFDQDRDCSSQVKHKDLNQGLLDKLTQEKLDSKTKNSKPNDLSSAYAWRTPFLSNRIACTEVPDASSDFSLFEALRETIYSEVATLISQNESRPHFLIELFHELQLLNTDYLRQRALYSLQDIVTRHLTEKSVADEQESSLGPAVWATGSQSELTPSESLATSDNDASEKNEAIKSSSGVKRTGDGDLMDNESLLSTSSNLEPFASDDLGNTVIHLDKALARMREYERMKLRAEYKTDNPEHSPGAAAAAASPFTQGAGHSSADAHCPQIDTQQLDRQIKAIMTEVIPFLKEHVGEVCSHQLLTSVRRMVLKLTQQNDESKEFVRFFHRQLGGILQDSLSKFVGRALQDCGEDLLVEISEILFNELAFFRLMQDLDQNTSKNKHGIKRLSEHTSPKHSPRTEETKVIESDKTFSPLYFDEDKDQDEAEQGEALHEKEEEKEKDAQSSEASEMEEEEGDGLPLSISLSKAETQALCNYGSGEDENEVEEIEEFEAELVEVQTSLQASMDNTTEEKQCSALQTKVTEETKSDLESSENSQVKSMQSESKDTVQSPEAREEAETASEGEREEKEVCTAPSPQDTAQGSDTASPDSDSPVMINSDDAGSGNTSQRSDEEDFVKVEDLPLQMSVLCEEQLCKRISEEQQNNNLTTELLNGTTEGLTGLVGNSQALKEPETIGAQSA